MSIFKEGSDKNYPFYIYEISKMNNKTDYVMKSSKAVLLEALKKIVRLASMDCRAESTNTVEIFWTL